MKAFSDQNQQPKPVVHQFEIHLPAAIHVNGTQLPAIDSEGNITNVGPTTLSFECNEWIPIPAQGTLTFAVDQSSKPLELPVDVISRVENKRGFWGWRGSPRFQIRLAVRSMDKEYHERYQQMLHKLLYGEIVTSPS